MVQSNRVRSSEFRRKTVIPYQQQLNYYDAVIVPEWKVLRVENNNTSSLVKPQSLFCKRYPYHRQHCEENNCVGKYQTQQQLSVISDLRQCHEIKEKGTNNHSDLLWEL